MKYRRNGGLAGAHIAVASKHAQLVPIEMSAYIIGGIAYGISVSRRGISAGSMTLKPIFQEVSIIENNSLGEESWLSMSHRFNGSAVMKRSALPSSGSIYHQHGIFEVNNHRRLL